ncbi:MAG TPA: NADH-ubiquinone oxidoreductase-F iron-sulfur binding region domain-containing protein [Candidatus Dormibacteraeota bacterium]|nr:NADH-ubiquinone oxidoreductase-F iron-sulfur binding region domain-containing protein [Candidatus Dormibacteraeota bacterium]
MPRIQDIGAFTAVRESGMAKLVPQVPRIAVGMGTCGRGNGAEGLYRAFAETIDRSGMNVVLASVGCFGACFQEPLVNIRLPGLPLVILHRVQANDAVRILHELSRGNITNDLAYCKVEEWDHITAKIKYGRGYPEIPLWNDVPFFKGQKKIVLRNCGFINPDDIEEYIAVGGYQALYKVLIDGRPENILEQIKASKLRGRGGAGYLTGNKWEFMAKAKSDQKYIICNADEGDPGAYMNRNEIESDPHSLIEGMIIGGYVMGATEGIVYIRAEYPLAVHRLNRAIEQAREHGVLGDNILGRGFKFNIELVEGAGAFVCGEETALIASLEGCAGRPRPRPPFPAHKGLWGQPTNINNVETWYNISPIVTLGPAWFTETGSPKSSGTKVFSLVGKVSSTGLVEMPLGTPLRTFIYDIGEGGVNGHQIKAVQTGGPSGGCIPPEMFDTPVDYESLAQLGSIMGSGGMVVMDDDNCMVDVARYFIEFTHSESCGKCLPCRVGLNKSLRILNRITEGVGTANHLTLLDELSRYIRECSLCGLGQTAPNPVLTTLRHFYHEFEDHIVARRCQAGVCEELALSPCENSCPLHMNIPRFLQLYKENRLEDAFLSVIMENPLPASTGRVCQHPCDSRCRRQTLDEPVNMREVHRFIADSVFFSDRYEEVLKRILSRKLEPTGRKIAISGAGPAGLTAAFYLAMLGHDVTVYDSKSEAGGMLRFALPEYRLPKAALRREVELIERLGVKFIFNTRVGLDVPLNELADRFDSVFISIGTWKESWVYQPGTEMKGVYPALLFLEAVSKGERVPIGKNVAIIGGGNAAIDSARTALRRGAEVTVFYRREHKDMPAIEEETQAAKDEGAQFVFLAAPHRVIGDKSGNVKAIEIVKTTLGGYDASGRRKPVPTDEIRRYECDSVIFAIGESVDLDFARASGLSLKPSGTIDVDRFSLESSRAGFYAGGDVITGASNVSNAMAYGKQAARNIDMKLMESDRWTEILPNFEFGQETPEAPSPNHRNNGQMLAPVVRVRSNAEVVLGLSHEEALDETCRCLRCDVKVANVS